MDAENEQQYTDAVRLHEEIDDLIQVPDPDWARISELAESLSQIARAIDVRR
jgi:hypothetical protein